MWEYIYLVVQNAVEVKVLRDKRTINSSTNTAIFIFCKIATKDVFSQVTAPLDFFIITFYDVVEICIFIPSPLPFHYLHIVGVDEFLYTLCEHVVVEVVNPNVTVCFDTIAKVVEDGGFILVI